MENLSEILIFDLSRYKNSSYPILKHKTTIRSTYIYIYISNKIVKCQMIEQTFKFTVLLKIEMDLDLFVLPQNSKKSSSLPIRVWLHGRGKEKKRERNAV